MSRPVDLLKWRIARGREPQSFLGARWVPAFLKSVPESTRRKWALRTLALSPHYFFDRQSPAYRGLAWDEFLEAAFIANAESRREACQTTLRGFLESDFTVLEYGCGPGFLAKALSPFVRKVWACDTSIGALACARVLNSSENIAYVTADERGLSSVADGSLDVVLTFALVQHLTDEGFESVLETCRRKLKTGSRFVCQVQLEDEAWRTEADWVADSSLAGKLRYKHGLHCFSRSRESHVRLLNARGFTGVRFQDLPGRGDRDPGADSRKLLVAINGP